MRVARHALREAAQCIRRASRTSDYCMRIGMSRFGVVLTETDEIEAINFVERVRESGPRAMPKGTYGLQFNFGWASPKQGESADAVVRGPKPGADPARQSRPQIRRAHGPGSPGRSSALRSARPGSCPCGGRPVRAVASSRRPIAHCA